VAGRATLAELGRRFSKPDDIHVLHYIGHGAYDEATETGVLVLETPQGRVDDVSGDDLGAMLQDEQSLRLVVLNSCEGARTSRIEPFSGVATSLLGFDIPAVIGMQFEISDEAAIAFSESLYTGLAQGLPVDAALAPARRAIRAQRHTEFATPVLFLRATDAGLFDLPPGPAQMPPTPPTPEPGPIHLDLSADPQWTDALSAYWAQRWQEAVERFEALHARYPVEARVEEKLHQARRQRDIDACSSKADAAAANGDWDTAVTALENLAALDPAYPGVAARLEQARIAQRRKELVYEMTALHQAGQWDAVLAAAQELVRLDPENPDPDGIVSDAQTKMRERQLADRYAEALNHLDQEEWPQAADVLTRIERDEPGYRDAAALRATAEQQLQQQDLADKYCTATEAQESGDWVTATTLFGEIIAIDSGYRDAAARHQQCEHTWRVGYLQSELRRHANNGAWQAVLNVGAELANLDPAAADTDDLIERAREMLGSKLQQPGPRPDIAAPQPVSLLSTPPTKEEQPPVPPHGCSVPPTAGGDAQAGYPHGGSGVGALPKQAYTPWIKRVGAWIIDAIPLVIIFGIFSLATPVNCLDPECKSSELNVFGVSIVSIMNLLGLAYLIWNYGYRQGATGSSIGKSALKFKVVGAKTGQPIGFGMSILRQLAHVVDWITFCIGCLWPIWDAKRQTLADKMMSTVCLPI
jgi:tetratricopeptide (TPR) repeat protein